MPRPSLPCPTAGCPHLQPCGRHVRRPFMHAQRSSSLYDTARWRRESREYRAEYRFCVDCGAPATVVDHVIPHRGDELLFWDRGNWASRCHRCHNAKTGRETRQRVGGSKR